jgi:hypothetical protein
MKYRFLGKSGLLVSRISENRTGIPIAGAVH